MKNQELKPFTKKLIELFDKDDHHTNIPEYIQNLSTQDARAFSLEISELFEAWNTRPTPISEEEIEKKVIERSKMAACFEAGCKFGRDMFNNPSNTEYLDKIYNH